MSPDFFVTYLPDRSDKLFNRLFDPFGSHAGELARLGLDKRLETLLRESVIQRESLTTALHYFLLQTNRAPVNWPFSSVSGA